MCKKTRGVYIKAKTKSAWKPSTFLDLHYFGSD